MNRIWQIRIGLAAALVSLGGACLAADGAVTSKGSAVGETPVGSMVADAIRQAAAADVAFVPAASLRSIDLASGQVTDALAQAISDPAEPIVLMVLSGRQIREALERSVSLLPKANSGLLQVSGVTVRYDPSQPSGKRLGDVLVGRRATTAEQSFRVAMPRSLGTGGLGYFRVWGDTKPSDTSHGTMGEAVKEFVAGGVDTESYRDQSRMKRI